MFLDYPTDIVSSQVAEALDFGLLDLDRIERMILRSIAGEFFRLSPDAHSQQGEDHG
jgi:hypothetical protein